jgi:type II secretory pathway component PulL
MKELAFVKFIIESYEGVAMQRTLNAKRGEIEIQVPKCNLAVFDNILSDLKRVVFMHEIKKPVDYCGLIV